MIKMLLIHKNQTCVANRDLENFFNFCYFFTWKKIKDLRKTDHLSANYQGSSGSDQIFNHSEIELLLA
jgi:hypothetical protein